MAEQRPGKQKTILIVGKVGNGKSSTANTILLTDRAFKPTHSLKSNDTECQTEDNTSFKVICAPDLHQLKYISELKKEKFDEKREIESWCDKIEGEIDAVCLVIRCDKRFTQQEYDAYEQLKRSEVKQFRAALEKKLVLIFTAGDRLNGRDLRQDLESEDSYIEDVGKIWKDAGERFVVFDNTATGENRQVQVQALDYIIENRKPHPFPQHLCRLLLVGPQESLQAVQKNLNIKSKQFLGKKVKVFEHLEVNGFHFELTFLCKKSGDYEEGAREKAKVGVSPGPHAILNLTKGDIGQIFDVDDAEFQLHVEADKDLLNREVLLKLCEKEGFPTRNKNGIYLRSKELLKIGDELCNETMEKTESPGKKNASTYTEYIDVKTKRVG